MSLLLKAAAAAVVVLTVSLLRSAKRSAFGVATRPSCYVNYDQGPDIDPAGAVAAVRM